MWMKEVFGTDKPVIGMMHLMAMPTDPKYDKAGGIQKVIDRASVNNNISKIIPTFASEVIIDLKNSM